MGLVLGMKAKSKNWLSKIIWLILYVVVTLFVSFRFALIVGKNKDRPLIKYRSYYPLVLDWLTNLENGQSISDYLKLNGFTKIAVYGGRNIGEHLINQLNKTDVSVEYIIDKTLSESELYRIPVYRIDDELPVVDAIIVTPIWDYENIKTELLKQVNYPVISIKDIIVREKDE